MTATSDKFATCNLCEAICGIVVETNGPHIEKIRGDADDPFSRGHICPKAAALKDLHEDPDRLRHPLVREGQSWREVSWDHAFDLVAERLRDIQQRHGESAVAVYQGNPTVHSLGAMLFAPTFVRSLRTQNKFSATSVDQLPQMLAAYNMFGHQFFLPIPDIDRTEHFIILGANPVVSNGSLMTAPGAAHRIKNIVRRGGKVIVIDPRRTETAEIATEYHAIVPGTDALLLFAMVNTLFAENLVNLRHLHAITVGVNELKAAAAPFPAEKVATKTGIDADTIKTLAREFANAERAVVYGRVGICTQQMGTLASWLIVALNVLTGRIDAPGGAMFTKPALDIVGMGLLSRGSFGRWKSRVRGLPEFGGELPVSALAEEILTPGEGQIRALVTSAGNPVLSTPNGKKLDEALSSLNFMVSIDIYKNETTRHAHVILPPTGPLERDHYDAVFHALSVRNTARFSPAVFPKPPNTKHDWEIFAALTRRMSKLNNKRAARNFAEAAAFQWVGPARILDLGLRMGPHGGKLSPFVGGASLHHLRKNPHGVDFGPLEPCLPERLPSKDKKIQLAPKLFVAHVPRAAIALDKQPSSELLLVGRRELRSNNSWMHNSAKLMKGQPRFTLQMHPNDAQKRHLKTGDKARITSRVGSVEAPVEVTADMMPGVVSLPHGYGHNRSGVQLSVAQKHAFESANDITDETFLDPVSGNAALNGVPVSVELLHQSLL
ncbi:MAG: molybdopterin-dependent oxidoreductase [Polyangiaceae bacterium]|nr:molybdopterin-dependent oxidoreductase [Polyangiaceae bacterium]